MPQTRSSSNEEILHKIRYSDEWYHRWSREYFFRRRPLTLALTPSSPTPQVQLEQIQDSCNKSTAIYFITPHFESHTLNYSRDGAGSDIIHSIYEQWFRSHHMDIDFGKFVAKLICLKTSSDEQTVTGEEVISFHKAWCQHVETTLPLCSKALTGTEHEKDMYRLDNYGVTGVNQKQHMYYNLQPLFRALIMIIDNHPSDTISERIVHLVRTDNTSELSAPITFESVRPKFDDERYIGHGKDNVISTTLSAAIEFVMALELREHAAFPERQRDPSIVDEKTGNPMKSARLKGYTGPEIRGPSSGWVKLVEGEDVLPPVTPLVAMKRGRAGLPHPRLAHRRKMIKTRDGWRGTSS